MVFENWGTVVVVCTCLVCVTVIVLAVLAPLLMRSTKMFEHNLKKRVDEIRKENSNVDK